MEIEKSKVLIQFLSIFRQSEDVLFFLHARRLRGYTATDSLLTKTFHAGCSGSSMVPGLVSGFLTVFSLILPEHLVRVFERIL